MTDKPIPYDGWDAFKLAVQSLAEQYDVHIDMKQKYGRLDLNCRNAPKDKGKSSALFLLMEAIEVATEQTCQVCGASQAKQYKPKNWEVTLCQKCANKHVEPQYSIEDIAELKKLEKRRVYWYLSVFSFRADPIKHEEYFYQIYDVCHSLHGITVNCAGGGDYSPRRDMPSWTYEEVDKMVADIFSENPHIESIDFRWENQDVHRATREKPYSSKGAEDTALYSAGGISEDEWFRRLGVKKPSGKWFQRITRKWNLKIKK